MFYQPTALFGYKLRRTTQAIYGLVTYLPPLPNLLEKPKLVYIKSLNTTIRYDVPQINGIVEWNTSFI